MFVRKQTRCWSGQGGTTDVGNSLVGLRRHLFEATPLRRVHEKRECGKTQIA